MVRLTAGGLVMSSRPHLVTSLYNMTLSRDQPLWARVTSWRIAVRNPAHTVSHVTTQITSTTRWKYFTLNLRRINHGGRQWDALPRNSDYEDSNRIPIQIACRRNVDFSTYFVDTRWLAVKYNLYSVVMLLTYIKVTLFLRYKRYFLVTLYMRS